MNHAARACRSGLTLVELLVVVSLLALAALTLAAFGSGPDVLDRDRERDRLEVFFARASALAARDGGGAIRLADSGDALRMTRRDGTRVASIRAPRGWTIRIEPERLEFNGGQANSPTLAVEYISEARDASVRFEVLVITGATEAVE